MPILHFNQVLFLHFHRLEKRNGKKSVALRSTGYWQGTNFSHYQRRMRTNEKLTKKRFEMIFEVKRAADAHDKLKKSQSYWWEFWVCSTFASLLCTLHQPFGHVLHLWTTEKTKKCAHKWEKDVEKGVKKDFKHISLFIAELETFLLFHEHLGVCYQGSDSWVSPLDHIRTQSHAKVLLTPSPTRRTCYSASMVSKNGLVLWRSSVGKREKSFRAVLLFLLCFFASEKVKKNWERHWNEMKLFEESFLPSQKATNQQSKSNNWGETLKKVSEQVRGTLNRLFLFLVSTHTVLHSRQEKLKK